MTGVTASANAASHLQIEESGAVRRGVGHVNSGDSRTKRRSYDPICGAAVESGEGTPSSEYKKRRYFFCSEKCKHEFERAAERIRMQETARAGALFTHGKVRWGLA